MSESRTNLDRYVADLEGLWRCYDAVWAEFTPEQWSKRYGKDWTFADQPYHLAYFDRVLLTEELERGKEIPSNERWVPRTMNELDAWNAAEFAKRPAGQTVRQSLEEYRDVRERLLKVLSRFDDADLDTYRAWNHLLGGFTTLRVFLEMALTHNWGEYSELLFRAGRKHPEPPPGAVRTAVRMYLSFMAAMANPEAAEGGFSVAWDFTGPASAQWTVRVADGAGTLEPGLDPKASVQLRLTPDAFNIVMFRQVRNPMLAMLRGEVKMKGFRQMGRMKKVFPEPGPDDRIVMPVPS